MTELLNLLILSSEIGHFFCMIFVVYLGHGNFRQVSGFIFIRISFWEDDVLSSQMDESQK